LVSNLSIKTYHRFVDDIVGDFSQISEIVSIVLHGSMARNDVIPGISDIDLLFITADKIWKGKRLDLDFSQMMHEVFKMLREKYPEVPIFDFRRNPPVLIISEKEALGAYPIEYDPNAIKFIYGKKFPKNLFLSDKLNDRKALKKVIEWNLMQVSDRLVWSAIGLSTTSELQEFARDMISYTFKVSSAILAYKVGIIEFKKERIVKKVQKVFKGFSRIGFVKDNYNLAMDWAKSKKDLERLRIFIWEDLDFLRNILSFALK
jgi:predicted nucleotidyltransferase